MVYNVPDEASETAVLRLRMLGITVIVFAFKFLVLLYKTGIRIYEHDFVNCVLTPVLFPVPEFLQALCLHLL